MLGACMWLVEPQLIIAAQLLCHQRLDICSTSVHVPMLVCKCNFSKLLLSLGAKWGLCTGRWS